MLRQSGADQVLIDTGAIAEDVAKVYPGGVDKVLGMIGTTTLADALRCARLESVMHF